MLDSPASTDQPNSLREIIEQIDIPPEIERQMKRFGSVGAVFATFGSLIAGSSYLKDAERFTHAVQTMGTEIPTLLRNHGNDMGIVGMVTACCLMAACAVSTKEFEPNEQPKTLTDRLLHKLMKWTSKEDNAVATTALFGMAASTFMMWEEYSRLFLQLDPEMCQKVMEMNQVFTAGTCRGDWGDIAGFAVPMIAGGIYLSRALLRSRYTKTGHLPSHSNSLPSRR